MQLCPGIDQYDIPETLAKEIILACSNSEVSGWEKSVAGDPNGAQNVRTSSAINLDYHFPELAKSLSQKISVATQLYSLKYQTQITQNEGLDLLRYGIGEKYSFHSDTDWHYYRTVSLLVYLNPSEYSGGETEFKHFNIKIKPEKPAIVIFPSNYSYMHSALPVTEGEKFIVVSWMNDLPIGIEPDAFWLLSKERSL